MLYLIQRGRFSIKDHRLLGDGFALFSTLQMMTHFDGQVKRLCDVRHAENLVGPHCLQHIHIVPPDSIRTDRNNIHIVALKF